MISSITIYSSARSSGNLQSVFADSLLISYCSFSSLPLSSIVMISFYILSKILFLKREGLSDARVTSITKTGIWICSTFFMKIDSVFKVNI